MAGVNNAVSVYVVARSQSQRDGSWLMALENEDNHFYSVLKIQLVSASGEDWLPGV